MLTNGLLCKGTNLIVLLLFMLSFMLSIRPATLAMMQMAHIYRLTWALWEFVASLPSPYYIFLS